MENIKQAKTTAFDVLFVKIPKEAVDVEFVYIDVWARVEFGIKNEDEESGFYGEIVMDEIELTPDFTKDWPYEEYEDFSLLTDDLANVTEEQAAIVVDKDEFITPKWPIDYAKSSKTGGLKVTATVPLDCPNPNTKSLHSLAESVQAYIKNPVGDKPKNIGRWIDKEGIDSDYREFVHSKKFKAWRKAEANTGRWAVLFKPKNS